jgi:hypothetical protein
MTRSQKESTEKRKYPEIYEKLIPITIGTIAIIIVAFIVFALGVAVGLIQGT